MDTKALEKFCPWARTELINAVHNRCIACGLDEAGRTNAPRGSRIVNGTVLNDDQLTQRDNLFDLIDDLGYDAFCEREAYTWFNRFAGIRYMELHGYLPSRVRMLSSDDGSFDPECLRAVGELDLPDLDRDQVLDLAAEGNDPELFRLILIAQCNELADALPAVFDHVDDVDALMLPDGLLDKTERNVLYHLVTDIPEEAWSDVEVLGWMYQFYNAELKEDYFKSKRKATPQDIAPATQLFTPDWIVRYMVDNSLGRLWMLNFPDSHLRERATAPNPAERLMEYYIEPDEEHEDFIRITGPEDITFCDPACGSGHILVYAFQMLFAMYEERGYRAREIPELILTKNLSGMEVDPRAAQIAELALALCAREHDRRFFGRGITADIRVLESIEIDIDELPQDSSLVAGRHAELLDSLNHLGEIGSLLTVNEHEMACLQADTQMLAQAAQDSDNLLLAPAADKLDRALDVCKALSRRFDVVVANPPYMGSSSFNLFMSKWVKKHYPEVKSDLFSAFIVRIMSFALCHGEIGMMTPYVWMFISSYEKLRNVLIDKKTITSLIQLEYSGFAGATVPICTFTFHNSHITNYRGGYIRLSDFAGAANQGPKSLEAIQNPDCGWFYRADAATFHDIPGSPIAYWASDAVHAAFLSEATIASASKLAQGLKCGKTEKFVRRWFEVGLASILPNQPGYSQLNYEWHFLLDGGDYRKWAGNQIDVIYWKNNGYDIKNLKDADGKLKSRVQNERYYHSSGCATWSALTSGPLSLRTCRLNCICGGAGYYLVPNTLASFQYQVGFLNTSVAEMIKKLISSSMNNEVGDLKKLPLIQSPRLTELVNATVNDCITASEADWDSQETSWDFKRNALV